MNEDERIIEQSEILRDQVFQFLTYLRDSGSINMMGATPVIMEQFSLTREDARQLFTGWIESLNDE